MFRIDQFSFDHVDDALTKDFNHQSGKNQRDNEKFRHVENFNEPNEMVMKTAFAQVK